MRIILFLALLAVSLSPRADAREESGAETGPRQILDAAERFLTAFAGEQSAEGFKVTFSLGRLDPRLRLAHCPDAMDVEFSRDPWRSSQPSLQVSCDGDRPWRMYLSSTVEIRGDALVAARPLGRGDRLQDGMIGTETVVINSLRQGAITRREDLIGMEMKRPVNAGTVFAPQLVSAPDAVARGDHVIIRAKAGTFAVTSRGKALASGGIGDQVPVQNLASSRTIRARITAPGQVEIPM